MQPEKQFYPNMTQFCIIYQSSCMLIFLTTRTHNTWSSQRILFFKIFNIFLHSFENWKSDSRGGVRGEKAVGIGPKRKKNFVVDTVLTTLPTCRSVDRCVDDFLCWRPDRSYADDLLRSLSCSNTLLMAPANSRRQKKRSSTPWHFPIVSGPRTYQGCKRRVLRIVLAVLGLGRAQFRC
jgi:hypothetical protein